MVQLKHSEKRILEDALAGSPMRCLPAGYPATTAARPSAGDAAARAVAIDPRGEGLSGFMLMSEAVPREHATTPVGLSALSRYPQPWHRSE
jgi:hypothetical protein